MRRAQIYSSKLQRRSIDNMGSRSGRDGEERGGGDEECGYGRIGLRLRMGRG